MNVVIAGSKDRQLKDLLRPGGAHTQTIGIGELVSLSHPASAQPDVLILDLREETQFPAGLAVLKRQHPTTPVVIVAERLDPTLMLDAMRAGVNECVVEPVTQADLDAALSRVVATMAPPSLGQVFAFIGAKGGIGTTTLAVNTATALARVAASGTLFIDFHMVYGDAALFFGAEPRFSVADALENTHRFDAAYFGGLVVKTKAGVDLLAGADRPTHNTSDVRRVQALVEFAKHQYRYTILDVPRSDASVLDALDAVTSAVIVGNQELGTVRSAGRMATSLRRRYGNDKVRVVMSRYDSVAEIGQEDVERAVGMSVAHTFPSDYRMALQALTKGRPVALDNHNKLSASFTAFARELAGLAAAPAPKASTGLFGRLAGRK